MSIQHALNIADLRNAARARLPNVVFDYLDGAAEKEWTARDNIAAFDEVIFKPRQAIMTPVCDFSSRILGVDVAMPFLLAPIGYSRLLNARGERAAACGAARVGTGYILSTVSGHAIENIAADNPNPFMQLYLMGGREASQRMLERAQKAGFKGLFVTIDTAVAGLRERDFRNGMKQLMGRKFLPKLKYAPNVLMHPGWLTGWMMDGGMPALPNVVLDNGPMPATDVAAALENAHVCWDDLKWIRDVWKGPIAIKGVMSAEDARIAVDHGVQGVVVSNHGGRQLDSVSGSLRVLPGIVEAVGDKCEVIFDGGIRSGSDVVKALCLGARSVLLGRAYAYGMAAAGDAGVNKALEIIKSDMQRTLKLLGCGTMRNLDKSYVMTRPGFRLD